MPTQTKKRPLVAILEDCKSSFLLTHQRLKDCGYEVVDANLLFEFKGQVSAFVTDWFMPPHMESLRDNLIAIAKKVGVPVCVYTGSPESVNIRDCEILRKEHDDLNLIKWLNEKAITQGRDNELELPEKSKRI
jgi:hypothetical protein